MNRNASRREDDSSAGKYVPLALESDEEIQQQKRQRTEAAVVHVICDVFKIPKSAIWKVARSNGQEHLSLSALNEFADSPFPAKIIMAKPQKGRGEAFTLNRFLTNSGDFPIIKQFFLVENLERCRSPIIFVGVHPRIKSFVVATNMAIEPECDHIVHVPSDWSLSKIKSKLPQDKRNDVEGIPARMQRIICLTFENLLQAMKAQAFWIPHEE